MPEMYCFAKICCLCLQHNPDLNKLEDVDSNGLTFFEKLVVLIPGFETLVMKSIPNYLCRKCKRYLNKFVKFRQNCLKSYRLLESYVKQLDNPNEDNESPEIIVIEDDLILMKEDMEECLKSMEKYENIEETSNKSPSREAEGEAPNTSSCIGGSSPVNRSPKADTSGRKRTRESKKISYNEEYDSDAMVSDSELYYTKGAKRKAKPTKQSVQLKGDKTVVIPQNDVFAKDLTKTINDIITRLSADHTSASKPEFKVKFKNSSGKTEQLSIYQDKDTVEIKFTKEEKMGHLKVFRSGDSFILTHNMSEPTTNKLTAEQLDPATVTDVLKEATPEGIPSNPKHPENPENSENLENLENGENEENGEISVAPDVWKCTICSQSFKSCYALTKHVNNYMDFSKISCRICDRIFEHVADLKRHIIVHSSTKTSSKRLREDASITPTSSGPKQLEAGPEIPPKTDAPSSKSNNYCEIKVVLSEIQEASVKSERSSSPEYQFHLSDDTDDEFDTDTIILGSLDRDTDFNDGRSPSPLETVETSANQGDSEIPRGNVETEADQKTTPVRGSPDQISSSKTKPKATPEDVLHLPLLSNGSGDPEMHVGGVETKAASKTPPRGFQNQMGSSKTDVKVTLEDGIHPIREDAGSGDPEIPRGCVETEANPRTLPPRGSPNQMRSSENVSAKMKPKTTPEDVLHPELHSNGFSEQTEVDSKPPSADKHCPNGNSGSNQTDKLSPNGNELNGFQGKKLLKIIINKTEVDEFMRKKKEEARKMVKMRRLSQSQSPGNKMVEKMKICGQCQETFKTQGKLEDHLEKVHGQ